MGIADTRQLIIQATFDTMADIGIARLSLEEVATRAGVSRQTLYRHFGNRRSLIEATIAREEVTLLEAVVAATRDEQEMEPALAASLATLLRWAADHPLLGRLLVEEPETMLPLLTARDAPVLLAARPVVAEVLRDRLPGGVDLDDAVDVVARIMLSYAIDPPAGRPEEVAGRVARVLVTGLGG